MSETCGCEEVGPLLVAPGTSGRSWKCDACGKVWTRGAERHPYAGHPSAAVLADHQPVCVTKATPPAAPVSCCCGVMVSWCDFSAHQTGMLQQAVLLPELSDLREEARAVIGCLEGIQVHSDGMLAQESAAVIVEAIANMLQQTGLLADGPPPETLTERVLAERRTT